MDQIAAMRSFVRTVETGSFSAVAREVGTSQPTVSKHIAALEEHLGVRLLTRSTRSLSLTEEGQRFYERALGVLEALEEAESSVRERERPSGLLRVSCPLTFGQYQVVPRLRAFLERYPEVRVDLNMSDQFVDLIEEGVDVAIRAGRLEDSSFVARRVATTRRVTVAAPEYLERAGEPRTPADLAAHECLLYTGLRNPRDWRFEGPEGEVTVSVSGRLQANSTIAMRRAALGGNGIAVVPIWMVSDLLHDGSLETVLRDYDPTEVPIYVVYPSRRLQPAKVRCFVEFMAAELGRCQYLGVKEAA